MVLACEVKRSKIAKKLEQTVTKGASRMEALYDHSILQPADATTHISP